MCGVLQILKQSRLLIQLLNLLMLQHLYRTLQQPNGTLETLGGADAARGGVLDSFQQLRGHDRLSGLGHNIAVYSATAALRAASISAALLTQRLMRLRRHHLFLFFSCWSTLRSASSQARTSDSSSSKMAPVAALMKDAAEQKDKTPIVMFCQHAESSLAVKNCRPQIIGRSVAWSCDLSQSAIDVWQCVYV